MENISLGNTIDKQSVFIEYTCMRNIPYLLLKYFKEDKVIQEALKDYIYFEPIIKSTDKELYDISMRRKDFNILNTIPKCKGVTIDVENSLRDIIKSSFSDIINMDDSFYAHHSIHYMIFNLLVMEFCNKIYIYYPDNIIGILEDIIKNYGENDRLIFISGEFEELIYECGACNLFILDDYKKLEFMKEMKMLKDKEFLLSNHYYNLSEYKEDIKAKVDIDEEKEICMYKLYSPMNVNIIKDKLKRVVK